VTAAAHPVAQIDQDIASFSPLHDAGDDFPYLFVVFVQHLPAFGFPNALYHDLLGRLRGDTPKLPVSTSKETISPTRISLFFSRASAREISSASLVTSSTTVFSQ